MIDTQGILLSLILALDLSIAFYVLSKNYKNIVNYSFFIFVFGTTVWTGAIALLFNTQNFFFSKFVFIGAGIILIGLTLFAKVFPKGEHPNKYFYIYFLPAILIILSAPLDTLVSGMIIHSSNSIEPINGPLFPLFIISVILYFFLSIFFLIKNFLTSTNIHKKQLKYLISGIFILMTSIIIFNVFLPGIGIYQFNIFGPASSIFFVGLTAYAIVRHQLMDISIVIQKGLIFSVLLAIITGFYLLTVFLLGFLFKVATDTSSLIGAGITVIIGIFGAPYIEQYFKNITDKIFFKGNYSYSNELEELSKILSKKLTLNEALLETAEKLKQILRAQNVIFILPFHRIISSEGVSKYQDPSYFDNILYAMDLLQKPVIHEKFKNDLAIGKYAETNMAHYENIVQFGSTFNIYITLPIIVDKKFIGVLCVGNKLSGDKYTKEDLSLLKTFSYQAGVAIEKIDLYEQVKQHTLNLEKKISKRTAKIKSLQEEQEKIMIDISHNLQTPLAVIKSELRHLKPHVKDRKKISAFEKSIDEVSKFIYNLLNLTKLERKDNILKLEPINISSTILDFIEYFELIAKEKNISLENLIEDDIYVMGSKEKLEEVIVNLVSNASKYMNNSDERKINISLKKSNDFACIKVKDTGIGIRKEDISNIFSRFYRSPGKNISNIKGSGIGLAICKIIVEKHNGTIKVRSKLGKGSEFTVAIPLYINTGT